MIACDGAGACCPGPWVRQQRVKPYAIPFAIGSSEATHIGSFMGGPQLGPALGAAGFFIVSDRSARDLPIAQSRLPAGIPLKMRRPLSTHCGH